METLDTPDLTMLINRVEHLHALFRFKKIIVDSTGLGAGVKDILTSKLHAVVEGIWYTSKSKAEIFNNLKLLMTKAEPKLYIPNYSVATNAIARKLFYQLLSITQEFKEATTTPKISHEAREHDDLVNALALAATYFNVRKRMHRNYGIAGFSNA